MSEDNYFVDLMKNIVEEFVLLQDEYDEELEDANLETWIKDIPSVRLSWDGNDSINRNITVYAPEKEHDSVKVEVNAWSDKEEKTIIVRQWYHSDVTKFSLTETEKDFENIVEALYIAFEEITEITQSDLDTETKFDANDDLFTEYEN